MLPFSGKTAFSGIHELCESF